MILPARLPLPELPESKEPEDIIAANNQLHHAIGFNAALDAIEALNMKPDGHYWDHTSKDYRELVGKGAVDPETPKEGA